MTHCVQVQSFIFVISLGGFTGMVSTVYCQRGRECVWVCVVQLAESWVYNPEDSQGTGSNPRAGGKKTSTSTPISSPAHPSVKQVPGLVLGS